MDKPHGAVEALEAWLLAWSAADYVEYYQRTQKTWVYEERATPESMEKKQGLELVSFKVFPGSVEAPKGSEVMVDITAALTFKVESSTHKSGRYRFRLICEKGPYNPHKKGTWGVNPASQQPVR